MIGIIDAKSGNIGSVENALNYLNIDFIIINKKDQIKNGMNIILPGVGSFHRLVDNLNKLDFTNSILEFINKKNPFLGICVGMQILLEYGQEEKKTKGLGIFEGHVIKFKKDSSVKIPLISWLKIDVCENEISNKLINNCDLKRFYFLHSYFCDIKNTKNIVAYSKYNKNKYPAIINENNVFGVQFHPEKSREDGLQLLKNFSDIK
jgi:glutamine amidotransferase|tara:strand:- start:819 stop:1436 length:618 start_codon:yes stop_codon:yes gene_type:complete